METLILLILITGNPGKVGGTNFTELSKNMVVIELGKAQEVLTEARRASQRVMSKDRIRELKESAEDVLGATVQCSSSEVTSYEAK